VTYIFMAVHYPAAGCRDQVYASMRRMASSLAEVPGLLEVGPWLEHDGDRVVGLSRWESREAFEAAMPGSGVPNDIIHAGESRPRDYFRLTAPAD
jgi:heme-degrading monooxygenase HmoA